LAGGYWWASSNSQRDDAVGTADPTRNQREVLYWYDPMVPDQHFDQPGKSPFMDMMLVPKYADEGVRGSVRIDPGVQQSVGIRTAEVEVDKLPLSVRVPGTLTWDLRRESTVAARVEAIVTRVYAKAPFTPVRRGEPLVSLLAPAWVSALAETAALDVAESPAAKALRSAARERLLILGIEQGADREGNVIVAAPADGVVTEVLAREGQTVTAGVPLFRVNGTATLWLEAAVPQALVGALAPGSAVEAQLEAFPGEVFRGSLEALLPDIDNASRTQRARIVLENSDGRLVPGMLAEVALHAEPDGPMPLVPAEALILTGVDSRVIVADDAGAFRPVRVRTGRSSGGRTEILSGLTGGERIVVSGQFLIDSEASLAGAMERLGEPDEGPVQAPQPHEHGASEDAEDGQR
jgi:Cu(I)/Ag(I) efflux system membrane fusion protein